MRSNQPAGFRSCKDIYQISSSHDETVLHALFLITKLILRCVDISHTRDDENGSKYILRHSQSEYDLESTQIVNPVKTYPYNRIRILSTGRLTGSEYFEIPHSTSRRFSICPSMSCMIRNGVRRDPMIERPWSCQESEHTATEQVRQVAPNRARPCPQGYDTRSFTISISNARCQCLYSRGASSSERPSNNLATHHSSRNSVLLGLSNPEPEFDDSWWICANSWTSSCNSDRRCETRLILTWFSVPPIIWRYSQREDLHILCKRSVCVPANMRDEDSEAFHCQGHMLTLVRQGE